MKIPPVFIVNNQLEYVKKLESQSIQNCRDQDICQKCRCFIQINIQTCFYQMINGNGAFEFCRNRIQLTN